MKEEFVQELGKVLFVAAMASVITSSAYLTYRLQKYFIDGPSE